MVESYVLDSGVLLLLARGKALGTAIAAKYGLLNPGVRPLVSIVSHGELWALAKRNEWGEPRRSFLSKVLLENLVTVELSQPVIDAYVELDYTSFKHPSGAKNMGKNDLWIAATARAAQATLITTDKDFEHLHPGFIKREFVDQASGP